MRKSLFFLITILIGITVSACAKNVVTPSAAVESPTPIIMPLTLTSPAFINGAVIPLKYTCDGEDINPALVISNAPSGIRSFALIVDDPDAPSGDWLHWMMWNISATTTKIAENSVPEGAILGQNDFGRTAWGGPCPPSGIHHYQFKLYALDAKFNLRVDAGKGDLEVEIEKHLIEEARLVGTYERIR